MPLFTYDLGFCEFNLLPEELLSNVPQTTQQMSLCPDYT